jgi:hypothetical protein
MTPLPESPFLNTACTAGPPVAVAPRLSGVRGKEGPDTDSNPVAKATKGKTGTAGINDPVRRSTTGTGLRVGEAVAVRPATSELMDATAGETAPISSFAASPLSGEIMTAGPESHTWASPVPAVIDLTVPECLRRGET